MATPVLATKLFPPGRRRELVARPRLTELLGSALESGGRLTLVSAPTGFGKTTVLSDWLVHLGRFEPRRRAGWLSLDEGTTTCDASWLTWWRRSTASAWESTRLSSTPWTALRLRLR